MRRRRSCPLDFLACASFGYENAVAIPVEGGYRVSRTWHFCSGVPYASYHMGLTPVQDSDTKIMAVVPRDSFRMLGNWGDLIGLKGSGSHSVVVDDVFVPAHQTITLEQWLAIGVSTTLGYELHANPLYDRGGPPRPSRQRLRPGLTSPPSPTGPTIRAASWLSRNSVPRSRCRSSIP